MKSISRTTMTGWSTRSLISHSVHSLGCILALGASVLHAQLSTLPVELDFEGLAVGAINGQEGWSYTGTGDLGVEGVTVAEGGLNYIAADGSQIPAGSQHLHSQAGMGSNGKMNNWLIHSPVSVTGPVYVRAVVQLETRPEGSIIGAADPYEFFMGLTNNPNANGAPWNAYVALKRQYGPGEVLTNVGVESTNSGGILANEAVSLDQPLLLVAKYDVDGDGKLTRISIWLNPNETDAESPDHVVNFAAAGVVLSEQTYLKFRMQNMPARLDHVKVASTWAEVAPAAPGLLFPAINLDFEGLNVGILNGQDGWSYTGTSTLAVEGVAIAEGGLNYVGPDGGEIVAGDRHLYTQAGLAPSGKMNNWLIYSPVSIEESLYLRAVVQLETRAAGSTIGNTDPYEFFMGMTNNPNANGAPWNAYVALKKQVTGDLIVGVESTNSGGVLANDKVVLDQPMLLVAKYDIDGDGKLIRISVWVNPNEADADSPDHEVNFAAAGVVLSEQSNLKFRMQNMPARLDHVKVASTWAEVVPEAADVPPPPVAPEITIDVANIEATEGEAVTLSVQITGTQPFTIFWTKDGIEIPEESGTSLTLDPLTLNDAGSYRVEVSNIATTEPVVSDPITLVVNEFVPPTPVESFLLETFDAVADGEGFAGVDVTSLGWNVHHSYAGVYLPGLATGIEAPNEVFRFTTSSQIGDAEFGTPNGYMQFFIDNRPLYGSGGTASGVEFGPADLPGPHPVTGQYYSNRTLATFLWKEVEVNEDARSRLREFNFVQGNRDAMYHQFFPAVRVGDQWFVYIVSNETLRDQVRVLGRPSQFGEFGEEGVFSGGQFNEGYANHYNAQPYKFLWSESGWTELAFNGSTGTNSTVGMTLGNMVAGDLPAGAITAMGIFSPENIDPAGPSAPGYNFNGLRIDSIHVWGEASGTTDTFTFTFNNEGKVDNLDRPIQAANWDGVYSSAALPLVTNEFVFADLSEGVTNEETPGAYKAGFLFVSGKNDQPAPQAFLVGTSHLNVVNTPQWPQGGDVEVNPQTDWYAAPGAFTNDLSTLVFAQLREATIRTNPRNPETVAYHLALELDGVWYISAESTSKIEWEPHTFDITSLSWYTNVEAENFLAVDLGSEGTAVAGSAMPAGASLTAIGLYIDTGDAVGTADSWARVDSISLSAISSTGIRPPSIVEGPQSATLMVGDTIALDVTLFEPAGDETFQWFKDDVEIPGADSDLLILSNLAVAASGNYTVTVRNGGGSATSSPAVLTVLPMPTVTPTSQEVPSGGGTYSVSVETHPSVAWSSGTADAWIGISTGQSGFGSDTVNYSVSPNNNVNPRSGVLTVAGTDVVITQAGAAAFYDVFPDTVSFPAAGGSEVIEIEATPGAPWSALADRDWIQTPSPSSGVGTGTFTIDAGAYPGTKPRTGTVSVAGWMITVAQTGVAPDTLFPGAVPTEDEDLFFFENSWFGEGFLFASEDGIFVYTAINDWWAMIPDGVGYWIFDYATDTWFYSSDDLYPWVYSEALSEWLYIDAFETTRFFWRETGGDWHYFTNEELFGGE